MRGSINEPLSAPFQHEPLYALISFGFLALQLIGFPSALRTNKDRIFKYDVEQHWRATPSGAQSHPLVIRDLSFQLAHSVYSLLDSSRQAAFVEFHSRVLVDYEKECDHLVKYYTSK